MRNLSFIAALITLVGCADYSLYGGSGSAGTLTAGTWDDNLNFETFEDYLEQTHTQNIAGLPQFDTQLHQQAWERSLLAAEAKQQIDIALIIDTTASMGDELSYLQAEFDALSEQIGERYEDAQQHWALVLYRDEGDSYVTRSFDFTDDLNDFQRHLNRQTAGGGGDSPEAPDQGLQEAMELSWRTGATARMAFWIADAPHQPEDVSRQRLMDSILAAIDLDTHIYPIAASGTDTLTEYSMRTAAQLTQGRYLFLTDDSGVGGEHKEPVVPCYFVTRLDDAILRMMDIEMSGVYREPSEDELIRTGGDPVDGRCVLEDSSEVLSF